MNGLAPNSVPSLASYHHQYWHQYPLEHLHHLPTPGSPPLYSSLAGFDFSPALGPSRSISTQSSVSSGGARLCEEYPGGGASPYASPPYSHGLFGPVCGSSAGYCLFDFPLKSMSSSPLDPTEPSSSSSPVPDSASRYAPSQLSSSDGFDVVTPPTTTTAEGVATESCEAFQAEIHVIVRTDLGYTCSTCRWSTPWVDHARLHEKSHRTNAPFECLVGSCEEAFTTAEEFCAHAKAVHGSSISGHGKRTWETDDSVDEPELESHSKGRRYARSESTPKRKRSEEIAMRLTPDPTPTYLVTTRPRSSSMVDISRALSYDAPHRSLSPPPLQKPPTSTRRLVRALSFQEGRPVPSPLPPAPTPRAWAPPPPSTSFRIPADFASSSPTSSSSSHDHGDHEQPQRHILASPVSIGSGGGGGTQFQHYVYTFPRDQPQSRRASVSSSPLSRPIPERLPTLNPGSFHDDSCCDPLPDTSPRSDSGRSALLSASSMNRLLAGHCPPLSPVSSARSVNPHPIPPGATSVHPRYRKDAVRDSLGEKIHLCRVHGCGKGFKRLEHVKRHEKTHTADKPFGCNYPGCMKFFSRTDNLTQHRRTHEKPNGRNNRAAAARLADED